MELTLEKIDQLSNEFEKFKENLKNTDHQKTKDAFAFLEKYTPNQAFQIFALMKMDRDEKQFHIQKLASEIWHLEDRINALLGKGHEVIQERDELLAWVKENSPNFKSRLKWVVCIPEAPDSEPEYFPAASKEIANRVVHRYHNMHRNRFANHPDLAESINNSIDCCLWHGTDAEFEALKSEFFFNEQWFKEPMYECRCAEQIQDAFRDKEIVHCFNGDKELITDSIEEAKRFYGVA